LGKARRPRPPTPGPVDPRVTVFCHRGLYDRALKIPENSLLAIINGQDGHRHNCHELDARICSGGSAHKSFLAHDEVASRVTSKNRRWASLSFKEILEKTLVARRFNFRREDFASSYQNTGEKVPALEEFLEQVRSKPTGSGLTLQLDLRGNDFPMAIEWFSRRMIFPSILMLKGYNLFFDSGDDLLKEVRRYAEEE
jgi:glycerophosphoryl diester phosphodiesterase